MSKIGEGSLLTFDPGLLFYKISNISSKDFGLNVTT